MNSMLVFRGYFLKQRLLFLLMGDRWLTAKNNCACNYMQTMDLYFVVMDCQAGNCQVCCSCQTKINSKNWFLRIYENPKILTFLVILGLFYIVFWKILFYIFMKDFDWSSMSTFKPNQFNFSLSVITEFSLSFTRVVGDWNLFKSLLFCEISEIIPKSKKQMS